MLDLQGVSKQYGKKSSTLRWISLTDGASESRSLGKTAQGSTLLKMLADVLPPAKESQRSTA
jgi:hypothetical protein